MSQTERNLTVVGWVLPGTAKRRTLSRDLIGSRSSSILHHRQSKSQVKPSEQVSRSQQKSVTIIEGRKNLMLYLGEDRQDLERPQAETKVTMHVDYAASGDEGGEDLYRLYKKGIVEDLYSGKNITFVGVSSIGLKPGNFFLGDKKSMFQRLCKGALQVSKAAVYADDNRTPIFNLSFECVLIFKNRVEQSRTDNLTSIDEIELKITNLHEGIRSSKTHLRHFRDLLHKVYCLHVYKGKNKIASMVYLEVAKVNFFEVTDVSADQVAWLSLDFQILQYNLAKYRDPTKADAEFERRCSGFKLNAVLENALEDPAKIFLFAYLGKSTDYARSNYEVYRFLKGTEAGSYKLPSLSKLITSEVIKKGRQSIVQREGKKPVEPNYQHHTDDEMAVNPSSNNHLKKEVKNVKADHKKALEETVNQTKAKLTIQNPKKVRTKQLKSEVSEEDQHLQEAQSGSDNEEVLAMQANFSERSSYYEEAEKAQQVFSRQSRNAVVGGALSAQNGESTLHRSRPGINDDLTTSKLKHLLLKDMKKTAIVSEKEPTDESEDSYVEAIFSQVPGTVSKPKPESSKQKITVSAATIRRDSRAKSAARSRVTGREAAIEDLQADEDERFDLPKGKLVAMLSRMEMQNMQQTQECQSNQAELNSLREEHAQMVQKSKELKSANRVFKTERDSVALQIEKLSLENEDLKSKVAELTSIKSELESASKLLRISLDDTNTKLKSVSQELEDLRDKHREIVSVKNSSTEQFHGQVKVYESTIRELEGRSRTIENQCTQLKDDCSRAQ